MKYEIKGLNDQGQGICFVNNKITFVENTIPGDIVDIKIVKEAKKYQEGKVLKFYNKSISRVESFCPYADICGGCSLSELNYEDTLIFKKNKVKNIFKKFCNQDLAIDIIPSVPNLNYRNKITLKVKKGQVGYYALESNDLVAIDKCMLASKTINNFIKYIKDFKINNGEVIIRSNYNNELLINFITEDSIILPNITDLKIVGILKNGTILKGDNKFMELIDHNFYQVSYDSFFQVNSYICSKLFEILKDHILTNTIVLDLYCGVGTLGLCVSKMVNKIYGIEIIQNAVLNAITNAKINQANGSYLLGPVNKVLPKIKDHIDVVIIDPPRSGLDHETIKTIIAINPKQIIYIACDPITLARDIKELSALYEIGFIKCLDMFPYTYHVETVAVLKLKDK
jgi:23S rRNA (uracil1939-C5)-methyltransferase